MGAGAAFVKVPVKQVSPETDPPLQYAENAPYLGVGNHAGITGDPT